MRGAADDAEVRTVQAEISYVSPTSLINRRFVAPGVECNTGQYETHRVPVRDGRAVKDRFRLDVHGFMLAERPSAVRDFFDQDQVERIYPGEVEETVKALTGASRVALMSWMIRTSGDLEKHRREIVGYTPRVECSLQQAKRTSTLRRDVPSSWRVIVWKKSFRTAGVSHASSRPACGGRSRTRRRTGRLRCATRAASVRMREFRTRCTSWTRFPMRRA
jgi:hypothetical protein